MSQPAPSPRRAVAAVARPTEAPRLLAARICSAIASIAALGLFVVGLPTYVRLAYAICDSPAVCSSVQLTSVDVRALSTAGLSVPGFITLSLIVNLGASLIWFAIAGFLFWRRSDLPIVLLVAVQLVTQGATSTVQPLIDLHTRWEVFAAALLALNFILLFYVFALFPNGRFVPRWVRWLGLLWIAVELTTLVPGPLEQLSNSFVAFLCMMICIISAQAYRYWRVSDPIERLQTKWVVLAIAATTGTEIALVLPTLLVPSLSQQTSLYQLFAGLSSPLYVLFGPIALAVALSRYRLYDIDVIIRRTLVYSSLTAILAALYFAVVLGAQVVGQRLVGQSQTPPWLIVLTTLLIATLFMPLRRRIQRTIDRRFYRSRYDAARTVEAFAATLRTDLDLSELGQRLVSVVEETMQPEHVSLWMRSASSRSAGRAERQSA